ncbi:energy transducer TonB [Crocinitomicaceae bacterium CZZ-1]|uniref:Energy transducer TonB n=1 Tax=Taishania pollutisoli TaxID=2766479 RepID=A0A8J6PAV8_9FLAO|nr:energy transducer TonB [Taishania pollutisoli]MBC9813636.1 energy transducer TonB [Taishania pollutisoli]
MNKFYYSLFTIAILLSLNGYGQNSADTLFLNEYNKQTSVKDSIHYYQIIDEIKNGVYFVKRYTTSDVLIMTGGYTSFDPEVIKEGEFVYYYESGSVKANEHYKNNQQEGKEYNYYESGKLKLEANYVDGEYHGLFKTYYENGNVKREDKYTNGKLKKGKCYSDEGKKINYYSYYIEAEYPGGMDEMMDYLAQETKYPLKMVEIGSQTRFSISFCVDIDGSTTGIKLKKNQGEIHPLFVEEAVRVIQNMPKWKPGLIDGEPVKSYFNLPFTFKLK